MASTGIPLIDLSPLESENGRGRRQVAAAIRRAAESSGFFTVRGHGVPGDLVDRMGAVSRTFFDLPPVNKQRVGQTGQIEGGLTYSPVGAEALAATAGTAALSDLKESLDFGPGFMGDSWPAEPAGLRSTWLEYFEAMGRLAARLRQAFAMAIGLPPDYFEPSFVDHHSSLRVLNYPGRRGRDPSARLRAGVHTDYGFLTVLHADDAPGGLQVQGTGGRWVDVVPAEGCFVVNIGDALMRWTNDRWKSTPHRVVNPAPGTTGSTRRQSIAYFHNPAKGAVIDCLPAFRVVGQLARYAPVTYGDYAMQQYRRSHPHLRHGSG
jgi:isopenicillin N synthase-like dioxygenase